ncbi:MAG TPA: 4'-phosphopantetheinyl transferase superfamily protein [Chloroflexota bacterium]|nr:4'-phosphopantetheinyl transferase superfamily protein [Chloroflexota bacterium]
MILQWPLPVDPHQVLSEEECTAYERCRGDRADEWLAARIAQKLAWRKQHESRAGLRQIATGHLPNGQPWVGSTNSGLHCSVSHSRDRVAVAVSGSSVGIDIEEARPISRRLLTYVADAREIRILEQSTPESLAPIRLWTIKEAVLKAVGLGFSDPNVRATVEWASTSAAGISLVDHLGPAGTWLVNTHVRSGAVISIAHAAAETRFRATFCVPSELDLPAAGGLSGPRRAGLARPHP